MPLGDTFEQMVAEAQRAAQRPQLTPTSVLNAYTPQGEIPADLYRDFISRSGQALWNAAKVPSEIYGSGQPVTSAEMVGPAAELALKLVQRIPIRY